MYKTGEIVPTTGNYQFVKYINAPVGTPPPTSNEKIVPLKSGGKFPPINSTDQGAYWQKA
jgi:hypothetical protein